MSEDTSLGRGADSLRFLGPLRRVALAALAAAAAVASSCRKSDT